MKTTTRRVQVENTPHEPSSHRGTAQLPRVLDHVWSDWRFGFGLAGVLAIGFGLVSGWLTPRGPITTREALVSMAVALVVGLGAGLVTGSRWSLLFTPVVFVAVFELVRLGVDGPTVDGIRLGSLYGVISFVVGRGIQAVLVLLPVILGALYGVRLAARLGNPAAPVMGAPGWTMTAVLTLAVLGLGVLLVRPAKTAPILDTEGQPLPGSVSELATVTIGGHDQTMLIRGRSVGNPVLLYLAGGPGGTDIGAMRGDVTLEQHFVVVTWDQRGAGKSYPALDPTDTLTLERAVADTLELVTYLRDRFAEDKIYLVGNSWGATLGVLAVQRRPELFHAYVGTGQMVSQRETDIIFWEDTLAWAQATGNEGLVAQLTSMGPPPYEDLLDYEAAISHEHDWNAYPELDVDNEMPAILFVPEYTWMERFNGFRSFLDTFSVLYPQLQSIDFRTDAPTLGVPVYMVLGEHEARGRAVLADEWFDLLDAPFKERIVFEGAGHRPQFDQPAQFADLMGQVRADTYAVSGESG